MISEHTQERRYRWFVFMLVVLAAAMIGFPVVPRSIISNPTPAHKEKHLFSAPVIPFAPMPATEPVKGIIVEDKRFDNQ